MSWQHLKVAFYILMSLVCVCLGIARPYDMYQLFLEPISGGHWEVMTTGVRTGDRLIS